MRSLSGTEMIGLLLFFGVFPIGSMIIGYLVQRLRSRERLLAIEKGVPLPRANRLEGEKNFRLAGMICVAAGVGLLILFTSLAVSLLIPQGCHCGIGDSVPDRGCVPD